MIDRYDEVAPGFKRSVIHRQVIGPHEMEHEYGLIGGNIFHGELSARAAVPHAPGARLRRLPDPIAGPLQRRSATHGGGGVCGIPGLQAARAALQDAGASAGRRAAAAGARAVTSRPTRPTAAAPDARGPTVAVVGASERPD